MNETATDPKRAVAGGLAGGVAAWLAGYLVVFVLRGSEVENSLGSAVVELLTGENVTWKLVGWIFFNAHFVSVRIPGLFGQTARNFITGSGGNTPPLLPVLPPLLLVLAGVAAAWNAAADPTTAARNGAAVALGYLPLSLVGALVFAVSVGDATAGPTLVTAVLLAGAAYPLVFGAVGGLVGGHFSAE